MAQRIIDIAPNISLISINKFLNPEDTLQLIQEHDFDFVMDCIDSITPKINLIKAAHAKGCKVISSMGAGAKIDPSKVSITDISKTNTCPFAYYIRKRLKKEGIKKGITTVYSCETPIKESLQYTDGTRYKKSFYGTISYMPSLFGLYMASWVIRQAYSLPNKE